MTGIILKKFDEISSRMNDAVEDERAKVEAEMDSVNLEMKHKEAVAATGDRIIYLNVGGQKFTTKRSTLCQIKGSLFATMFSGRWEDSVERDEDGAVFFDFNPKYFVCILDYLRAKKIENPENSPPLPKVREDHAENFRGFVDYLGLSDEIVPSEIVPGEKFNLHSAGVTLDEDGKVAVHDRNDRLDYVLGKNVYQQGTVNLKLKLESFRDNGWVFVGILKENDDLPVNNSSVGRSGSFGWALGINGGRVWENQLCTKETALQNLTEEGDTVGLTLDCNAARLTLHLTNDHQFHIDIPKSNTWRLNIGLYYRNDKICIIAE